MNQAEKIIPPGTLTDVKEELDNFQRSMAWTLSRARREGQPLDSETLEWMLSKEQRLISKVRELENAV